MTGNERSKGIRMNFHVFQIKHKRHQFAFGSLVSDDYIVNPSYTGYQNLFYEFFNWATVGSYKWKYNQGNRVSFGPRLEKPNFFAIE